MEKITLSVQLVNVILQYLDTRPHGEVRNLIDAVQKEAAEQQAKTQQPAPAEVKNGD